MDILRILEVLVGLALWTHSFGYIVLKWLTVDREKWIAALRVAPTPGLYGWLWNLTKLLVGFILIMRVL